jgi:hypothetical protein
LRQVCTWWRFLSALSLRVYLEAVMIILGWLWWLWAYVHGNDWTVVGLLKVVVLFLKLDDLNLSSVRSVSSHLNLVFRFLNILLGAFVVLGEKCRLETTFDFLLLILDVKWTSIFAFFYKVEIWWADLGLIVWSTETDISDAYLWWFRLVYNGCKRAFLDLLI